MKLQRPFYRLPVRFDVARLRAEVDALPDAAWSRHPQGYEGNTAARLITVGGAQNDAVSGEMQATPALLASPYLQQVLASFGTVWSRSRLMRIEGGGSVPPHSDVNYHWYHRVRVHIPVITTPEVRFHCGDQSVHMAAGEAWIFDNWRRHKVENPGRDARIHLVADTAGTSSFWRLVGQGRNANFEQADPAARLIAFDPAAPPDLLIERFNVAPVMPPAEVEQLAFDLLADLAPADDSPESAAAVSQFTTLIRNFCRDWRSLWSLHGAMPGQKHKYRSLVAFIRTELGELPPVMVASLGLKAQAVFHARVLEMLLGGSRGGRREAAEFNASGPAGAESAARPYRSPSTPGFTVSRFGGIAAESNGGLPVIERPIIILSAPRAGSTLLFETLMQAAGVYTIGGESHKLIEGIKALHPVRGAVSSNRLDRNDATDAIVAELRGRFATELRDRDGAPPSLGAAVRLLEKTPKNALRVPFLLQVFPDALFIFLHRDPRPNLGSMMEAWRSGGWVMYRRLPEWDGDWSLLLPPGYGRLRGRPLEEIVAFQWQAANATILGDLETLARDRWTITRYEDLIQTPRPEISRLLEFAGLEMDPRLSNYLAQPLPLSRYTRSPPDPQKWKRDEAQIERVMPVVAAVAGRLGRPA
ncbi:MAG: sulfotransferase [Burkholderiales bacterium]